MNDATSKQCQKRAHFNTPKSIVLVDLLPIIIIFIAIKYIENGKKNENEREASLIYAVYDKKLHPSLYNNLQQYYSR